MIDISEELQTVQNEVGGDRVRSAVASAMQELNVGDVNIDAELLTIATGRYGIDIRDAIHDALYKLAYGTPEPQSGLPPVDAIVCADVIQSIAATVYVESKEEG